MSDIPGPSPDWKRRQQIVVPAPRQLEPTLGHRLRKMPPHEQQAIKRLMRSMLLRKTIKRVLYEAFQEGEQRRYWDSVRENFPAYARGLRPIPQPDPGAQVSYKVVTK